MSFRPGELSNPVALPQALQAAGYRYSSSTTANNSLTHLPYQLNYDRLYDAETDVFEFPVTVEDEELPKLGERLSQAVELAHQIGRYGGAFVFLIHPNILDHKLEFEKRFVENLETVCLVRFRLAIRSVVGRTKRHGGGCIDTKRYACRDSSAFKFHGWVDATRSSGMAPGHARREGPRQRSKSDKPSSCMTPAERSRCASLKAGGRDRLGHSAVAVLDLHSLRQVVWSRAILF